VSTTDAARLQARGQTITLMDGTEAKLLYAFRGLALLEDEFGSLQAVQELVKLDDDGLPVGKVIGPLSKLLGAGLVHLGYTLDQAIDLLDSARMQEYFTAASAALEEALPRPEAVGKAELAAVPAPSESTGPSPTTSPPPEWAGATTSSGTG
jgi:hypothetical protein